MWYSVCAILFIIVHRISDVILMMTMTMIMLMMMAVMEMVMVMVCYSLIRLAFVA